MVCYSLPTSRFGLIVTLVILGLNRSVTMGESGGCPTQEILDQCVVTYTNTIQENCYGAGGQNYTCLCLQLPGLAGCYENCPNEPQNQAKRQDTLAERESYCQVARQNGNSNSGNSVGLSSMETMSYMMSTMASYGATGTMGGGSSGSPTPTQKGLFGVTSGSSAVTISAGATEVIVPIKDGEKNSNTPVSGSLYHSYTLGSLTVGYLPTSAPNANTKGGKDGGLTSHSHSTHMAGGKAASYYNASTSAGALAARSPLWRKTNQPLWLHILSTGSTSLFMLLIASAYVYLL